MPKRDRRSPGRIRSVVQIAAVGVDEYLELLDEADAAALLPIAPWRRSCRRLLGEIAGH